MRLYRSKELERAAVWLLERHTHVLVRQVHNPTPSIRFRMTALPAGLQAYEWKSGKRDDFTLIDRWRDTGGLLYANRPGGAKDQWEKFPTVGGLVLTDMPLLTAAVTPMLSLCTGDVVVYEYGSYLPHEEALTDRYPSPDKIRSVVAILRPYEAQDATDTVRVLRKHLRCAEGFLLPGGAIEHVWKNWLWIVLGGLLAHVCVWRPLMSELPEYLESAALNCVRLDTGDLMWIDHATCSGRFSRPDRALFRQAVQDGYLSAPTVQWFASFEALHVDEKKARAIHHRRMGEWAASRALVERAEPLCLAPLADGPAAPPPAESLPSPDELPY